jgi:hypothetical protein
MNGDYCSIANYRTKLSEIFWKFSRYFNISCVYFTIFREMPIDVLLNFGRENTSV